MKYCATSGGSTGRCVTLETAGAAAAAVDAAEGAGAVCVAAAAAVATDAPVLIGSIKDLICVRVSGPRRYDIAQRVSKTSGASSCTLLRRKMRLPRPARIC